MNNHFLLLCWLSHVSYGRFTGGKNNTQIHCVLSTDDITIMTSTSKNYSRMFRIKFPTKRIFWIFPIIIINRMAPLCKLIYRTTLVRKWSKTKFARTTTASQYHNHNYSATFNIKLTYFQKFGTNLFFLHLCCFLYSTHLQLLHCSIPLLSDYFLELVQVNTRPKKIWLFWEWMTPII